MRRFKRVLFVLLVVIPTMACLVFGLMSFIQWAVFGYVTWGC